MNLGNRLFNTLLFALSPLMILQQANAAITRTPYLQDVQKTSAVIMWESDQAAPGVLHYGNDDKVAQSVPATPAALVTKARENPASEGEAPAAAASPAPALPENVHIYEAVLQNLKPGEQVFYQVEDGADKTPVKSFKTAPEKADQFHFAIYGDNRTQPKIHTLVGEQILKANPDLLLSTGDLVSRGPDYPQWTPQFFKPLENIIDHVCIWPSIGNHEGDGVNYRDVFHLPGDEMNYSFDYGDAHFVAIDTIGSTPVKVSEWLDQDLAASKAKWKFVYGHIPTYNAGGHESKWGRDIIPEIYRKHHVDIAFTGHSHLYERSHPIQSSYDPDKWPVLYIVTGGGGAPLYDLDVASYIAKAVKNYHMIDVGIDGDKLSARVINEKGELIDEFGIDKSNGHAPAYLSEAISEELTNFVDAIHSALEKGAPQSKAGETKRVHFNIRNKVVHGAVEITLRPEKAEFFESIEPETLTLTIEPGEEKKAEFYFKAAMDLTSENKDYIDKLKELAGKAGKSLSPVGLTRMNIEYKTPLGNGTISEPTLMAGGKFSQKD